MGGLSSFGLCIAKLGAGSVKLLAGIVPEARYCNDQQSLLIPAGAAVSPQAGPGQSPSGGSRAKAPGSSWNFAFSGSCEWPEISEDPAVYSTTK